MSAERLPAGAPRADTGRAPGGERLRPAGVGRPRVLVPEPLAPAGLDLLRQAADVDYRPDAPPDALADLVAPCDALIVRSAVRVTADVLAAAERLRVVGRAGVGVDNIDLAAATERGILVLNVPDGNTVAACEHTWALLLAVARRLPAAHASLAGRRWDRSAYVGTELRGKTLGIVGLGRIGWEVARRALAFGMGVVAFDPYLDAERAEASGVRLAELDEVLARADVLTVHCPLTPETRGLIGRDALARLKPGAFVVNCARGGIVDEAALAEALAEGRLAGAAVDVFEREPPFGPDGESPLLSAPNVVLTPHLGASTREAQEYNAVVVARDVLRALAGEPVENAVNLPSLPAEAWRTIGPYLPLAELLGRFYRQAFPGPLRTLDVTYEGELAALPTEVLTGYVLRGLLDGVVDGPVNHINAPALARRRGLRVSELRRAETSGYRSLITLSAERGGAPAAVSGTLALTGDLRIVRLGPFHVEIPPAPHMLITDHEDRPGIIGRVGTILGSHGINIAGMQVGRTRFGGPAAMVLQVDDPVPAALTEAIAAVPGIRRVTIVDLPPALFPPAQLPPPREGAGRVLTS